VIPLESFAEIDPRENRENGQRDHLLDDLQLECGEFAVTNAVRRNLKAILQERDHQLTTIRRARGAWRYFKCPYHAIAMKIFEQIGKSMVLMGALSYHGPNEALLGPLTPPAARRCRFGH
jgi:hypothetical protein